MQKNDTKFEISIDSIKCTLCTRCVKVCPSQTLTQAETKQPIAVQNLDLCISCGHCVMVCPEGAVCHSKFPTERLHKFSYADYPTPHQMMTIIRGRRSNRAFNGKQVPVELLEQIAEAAYRAPTASNAQQVAFTIITSQEGVKTVSNFTMGVFVSLFKTLTSPLLQPILKPFMRGLYDKYVPAFKKMIAAHRNGEDPILRGATSVLLIHTPKDSRFGAEDANLAYQNASLMAESLGVSQFYTGFVLNAVKRKKGKLERELGIDGKIVAGMAVGMSSIKYENYADKEPIKLEIK